jgi:hypothetical protein
VGLISYETNKKFRTYPAFVLDTARILGLTQLMLWFATGVAVSMLLRPSLFASGNDYDVAESGLEKIGVQAVGFHKKRHGQI